MRITTYTRISTDEHTQPYSLEARAERLRNGSCLAPARPAVETGSALGLGRDHGIQPVGVGHAVVNALPRDLALVVDAPSPAQDPVAP